jgi:5-methylcytosine-specific restriction endonuclease McrA
MAKGDTFVCRMCKGTFALTKSAKGFYCSTQCQKDYEWEQKKKIILAEGKVPNGNAGRRFLLERDGHVCQMPECGLSEWEGAPIPLILDHIDGDSDNWALNNIRLICPNCDALTDHYKGRNRGRGRHARHLAKAASRDK